VSGILQAPRAHCIRAAASNELSLCVEVGIGPQGVLCGQPAALTLHTADAFGNVCTEGGHEVAFMHQPGGASKAYKVRRVWNFGVCRRAYTSS
jgi:hypothetical protein